VRDASFRLLVVTGPRSWWVSWSVLAIVLLHAVIVQPHATVELERHQRTQKGTDKRHKATKDGNAGSDQISDDGGGESAGDPCSP
jgi:hypothetical protein